MAANPAFELIYKVCASRVKTEFVERVLEKLYTIDNVELQKEVVQRVKPALEHVEREIRNQTRALNEWLAKAPRFPHTPLKLVDLFQSCLANKSCPLYKAIKDRAEKNRYLLALGVCISHVLSCDATNSLDWIALASPKLRKMAFELQWRHFYYKGEIVMNKWLETQHKEANDMVAKVIWGSVSQNWCGLPKVTENIDNTHSMGDIHGSMLLNDMKVHQLQGCLVDQLPFRTKWDDVNEGWISVEKIQKGLESTILEFVNSRTPPANSPAEKKYPVPPHVLVKKTIIDVLRRLQIVDLSIQAGVVETYDEE